jgi:AP-1 complex subunit mu
LKPLIWVEVAIESNTTTKVEYRVKAKSNYRVKSIAHNVEIMIPVPNDLRNPQFKVLVKKFYNYILRLKMETSNISQIKTA